MRKLQWREEVGGMFFAENGSFRLKVHRTTDRLNARFLVLMRRPASGEVMLGSGTVGGLGAAMKAAEKMADRLRDLPGYAKQLVLLVDDDLAARGAVADVLRDAGYDVVGAVSGEGALRRLERITRPAVLVSDVRLGAGMSGIELAAIVRKLRPSTGILLVSGDTLPNSQVATVEFLAKPYTTDGILERVAATVRMQHTFHPSLH